jgi:AcrR family transcriptional regulator
MMAAALDLFVEKGYSATRLEEVAARAGVSKGALYLYFDSKEALFKAVISEGIVPLMDQGLAHAAEFKGSAAELLQFLLSCWWEAIGNTPLGGVPKLMVSEAGNFPEVTAYYHDSVIAPGRELIRSVIERGIAAGEFRPVDVDVVIDVIFAPVLLLAIWRHSLGVACPAREHDPARYLATHFDLILKGLRKEA